MKCQACGIENPDGNKYCTACGEKLVKKLVCNSCGKTVHPGSTYCGYCGARIRGSVPKNAKQTAKGKSTRMRAQSGNKNAGKALGYTILAVLILGIGVFVIWTQASPEKTGKEPAIAHSDVLWSPAVLNVAKNFTCPCGECTDRLDVCTCDLPNGAMEAKAYIRDLIESGVSEFAAIQKVEERYGHRL